MKPLIFPILLILATSSTLHCAHIPPEHLPNESTTLQRDARAADSKSSNPQILSAKLEIVLASKDESDSKDSKVDDEDSKNSTTTKDKKNSTTVTGSATLKTKRSPQTKEAEFSKTSEKNMKSNEEGKEKNGTMSKGSESEEKMKNKSKSQNNSQKLDKEQTKSDVKITGQKKTDIIIKNTDDKYDLDIEQRFRINDEEFRAGFQKGVKAKDEREMVKVNKEKQSDKNIKDEDAKN